VLVEIQVIPVVYHSRYPTHAVAYSTWALFTIFQSKSDYASHQLCQQRTHGKLIVQNIETHGTSSPSIRKIIMYVLVMADQCGIVKAFIKDRANHPLSSPQKDRK
jgi:hypothetical protein